VGDDPLLPGLVVRAQSGFFEVATPQGMLTAEVRGRLKHPRRDSDLMALGDRVLVRPTDPGRGLSPDRAAQACCGGSVEAGQLLVAVDQTFSCSRPGGAAHHQLLDRFSSWRAQATPS
jgi:hypothetical protein